MGISSRFNPQRFMIRQRLMSDPFCRLRTLPEVEVAAQLGIKIDVNQASVDDWLRLPGISIHQARSLVELVGMGVQLLCLEDVAAAISVPIHRLQPLEPILHFEYYAPESVLNPQRINLNIASLAEISQIPLIEATLAQKIVQNRQEHGNYRNLADLQRRLALSSRITSQLMYYLQF
jgi:DNA uptake protein ComE-like DNA-binding protein